MNKEKIIKSYTKKIIDYANKLGSGDIKDSFLIIGEYDRESRNMNTFGFITDDISYEAIMIGIESFLKKKEGLVKDKISERTPSKSNNKEFWVGKDFNFNEPTETSKELNGKEFLVLNKQ